MKRTFIILAAIAGLLAVTASSAAYLGTASSFADRLHYTVFDTGTTPVTHLEGSQ